MTALAVGVVDKHVEHRHPAQPDVVRVHQNDLVTGVVVGPQHRQIARPRPVGGKQVDQVGPGQRVGVDRVAGLLHPEL